jgi:2-polyprenyl-6-methoxyphenol hydroxylase-like FAD-dependent oxidoreductase
MNDTVVIAGAGPAGLMLACELGVAGVQAIVLERDPTPPGERFSPGTTLHARSAELFDRRGLMDDVRAEEPVIWPIVHFSNIWVDLTPIIDREYSLIVMQARTEQILQARAEKLGADIRRGHEVTGLEPGDDGVTVQVSSAEGRYNLRCRYLVGCDGGDSTVRELAGIEAPPAGTRWYGLLADFEVANKDWKFESPDYPGGLFAVAPHPGGLDLVRVMTMEFDADAPGDDVPPTAGELPDRVRRITGQDHPLLGEPLRIHRSTNANRLAPRYRAGNVFLAGDAAHLHYWGAGHGLNTSLHDAANLGWKLAADINGWAPPGLLDTYQAERHPVGRRACAASQASLALAHPQDRVAPLREVFTELMQFGNVQQHVVSMITDVSYPMPSADPHPLLGRPVPHVPLTTEDGDTTTQMAMRSGHAVLFDLSDGAQLLPDLTPWSGRLDRVTARPTQAIDATALLVRPDGHIAWIDATATDTEGLTTALTTWFGPRNPTARSD